VFVGGISQDTSEEHLRDYFKRYGQIENVLLMMDRKTGKNRGFAFIVFQFPEQADQCCSMLEQIFLVAQIVYIGLNK
jgi:RNA recognition motif-containing protein